MDKRFNNLYAVFQDLLDEAKKIESGVQSIKKNADEIVKAGADTSFTKHIEDSITTLMNKWDSLIKVKAVEHYDNIKTICDKFNKVIYLLLPIVVFCHIIKLQKLLHNQLIILKFKTKLISLLNPKLLTNLKPSNPA